MRKRRFTKSRSLGFEGTRSGGQGGRVVPATWPRATTFYIYGLLPRGKKAQNLVDVVDCKHLSGVTGRWCAQMGNPLTPASTIGRPRRPL